MKPYSLLIFIVLILSCDAPSEYVDEDGYLTKHEIANGKWHGSSTKHYPSGELAASANWKNGEIHGEFKQYFENGNLSMETTYVDGIEHGMRKTYYETGQLSATREIMNGQITGTYTKYFTNGEIENIAELENNQLNGESTIYDSLGNIVKSQINKNGIITSEIKYYENGKKQLIDELIDSINHRHYLYYESGEPKEYRFIKNDTLIYQKLYYKNGAIKGFMFPLTYEVNDSEICVKLLHSIIPKDTLGVEVFLTDQINGSFEFNEAYESHKSFGNTVCFPIASSIITGYLCETYAPDWNIEACFPFAFDVDNMIELNRSEYNQK
jgi:antitoxin component YwqK of YwqJK toxin-antitoxin module